MIEAIEEGIILSQTQSKAVDGLLEKLRTTGAVCVSDIISLEGIELPIEIDEYIPLNSFTVTASKVNLEKTAKLLNDIKSKATVEIKDVVTVDELIRLNKQLVYGLDTVVNILIRIRDNIDKQAISDLMLDMNSYFYNYQDELIDIRELTIGDLHDCNYLLQQLASKRGCERILDEEKTKHIISLLIETEFNFIFSLLEYLSIDHYSTIAMARGYTHRTFTFKEVINILLNLDTYIDALKSIINRVADSETHERYIVEMSDKKVYTKLLSILGNKSDTHLLEIISNIFKK